MSIEVLRYSQESNKEWNGWIDGDIVVAALVGHPWGIRESIDFIIVELEDQDLEDQLIAKRGLGSVHPLISYPYREIETVQLRDNSNRPVRYPVGDPSAGQIMQISILKKQSSKNLNIDSLSTIRRNQIRNNVTSMSKLTQNDVTLIHKANSSRVVGIRHIDLKNYKILGIV